LVKGEEKSSGLINKDTLAFNKISQNTRQVSYISRNYIIIGDIRNKSYVSHIHHQSLVQTQELGEYVIEFLTRGSWYFSRRFGVDEPPRQQKKVSLFFQVRHNEKKSLSFQILLGDIQFQEDHEPQPWYNIRNDQNCSLLSLEIENKNPLLQVSSILLTQIHNTSI
jgi:hypothetical protein